MILCYCFFLILIYILFLVIDVFCFWKGIIKWWVLLVIYYI